MNFIIRQAIDEDVGHVTLCVCQAFMHYILLIGKQPQPMLDNYKALIDTQKVVVATLEEKIAGVLVLDINEEGFCIETLAVYPVAQGAGIGRKLINFAENVAKNSGFKSIYLSTNRLMTKSQQIYSHLGYEVYDERVINGYDRLYLRKQLT